MLVYNLIPNGQLVRCLSNYKESLVFDINQSPYRLDFKTFPNLDDPKGLDLPCHYI